MHIISKQEPIDIKTRVDKSVLINQGGKIKVEKIGVKNLGGLHKLR